VMMVFIVVTAVFTLLSYGILAMRHLPEVSAVVTTFLVAVGIVRYICIIMSTQKGEKPERILYSDLTVTILILIWAAVFVHAIYV